MEVEFLLTIGKHYWAKEVTSSNNIKDLRSHKKEVNKANSQERGWRPFSSLVNAVANHVGILDPSTWLFVFAAFFKTTFL